MTTLNQHYKDRNPSETIQILQDFFKNHGYTMQIFTIDSPVGVKSCHIDLYKNGYYIARSNGKGMSKEYALASGLGELYERFCGKHDMYSIAPLCNFLEQTSYHKNNYFYCKDEKIVNSVEELNLPEHLKQHFITLLGTNEQVLKKYFTYKTNNNLVEVPFINAANNKESIYLNLPLLFHLTGSNGLAAGNNFYEAFNQGASELMERFCLSKFAKLKDTFYAIDIHSIKNSILKDMLLKIEEDNNHCIILDLSYTYNLPVIGLITINKVTLNTSLVFGCFPIFEIALERCITETYQNYSSYSEKTAILQQPLLDKNNVSFKEQLFSVPDQTIFPIQIFNQCKQKISYNKSAFLETQTYSNQDIYLWILKKLQENNISLFYRNISLTDKMYAIHLYSNEMSGATDMEDNLSTMFNDAIILEALKDLENLNNNCALYRDTNNNQYLFEIINFYYKRVTNSDYSTLTQCLGHQIPFLPLFVHQDYFYFLDIMLKIFENGIFALTEDDLIYLHSLSNLKEFYGIKKELISYTTFIKYLQSFESLEEIVKIFNWMKIDFNVKEEFNKLIADNLYFLKQTFFKLYNSNYNNLLLELYEPMIMKEGDVIES